jgi:hypothetical protein
MSDMKQAQRRLALQEWQASTGLSEEELKALREKRRRRKRYKFALNVSNPSDRAMADLLDVLRLQGKLTPYIRQGVALYASLKDGGSLDTLFKMFPWAKEVLSPQIDAVVALGQQMSLLEEMMANSGHVPIPFNQHISHHLEDDDFDTQELRVATSAAESDGDSVSNFLNSFGKV